MSPFLSFLFACCLATNLINENVFFASFDGHKTTVATSTTSKVIWIESFSKDICIKIPFKKICKTLSGSISIEETTTYQLVLTIDGHKWTKDLAKACYNFPVPDVPILSAKVCATPNLVNEKLRGVTLSLAGCIGVSGLSECFDVITKTINFLSPSDAASFSSGIVHGSSANSVVPFSLVAMSSASCDCDYHAGGCTISSPPPVGYLCQCVYKGAWTCAGHNVGCNPGDSTGCCANDASEGVRSSEVCCKDGKGDCGGY